MTVPWHFFIRWFGGGNFASSCQNVPFFEEIYSWWKEYQDWRVLKGYVTRTVTTPWLVDSKFRGLPETGMRRHLFFRIGIRYLVFDMISSFQIWVNSFDTLTPLSEKNMYCLSFCLQDIWVFPNIFLILFACSHLPKLWRRFFKIWQQLQSVDETDGMLGFQQLSQTTNVACGFSRWFFRVENWDPKAFENLQGLAWGSHGTQVADECRRNVQPNHSSGCFWRLLTIFIATWLFSLRDIIQIKVDAVLSFDLSCCYTNKVECMVGQSPYIKWSRSLFSSRCAGE